MKSLVLLLPLISSILLAPPPAGAEAPNRRGRIVIVMVWDGLRPDLVTARDTPNLFSMARDGVRFDRHHSLYPTLTMVNSAVLATGAKPGETGILGNEMWLAPALTAKGVAIDSPQLGSFRSILEKPEDLEYSSVLSVLNSPQAFAGRLVQLDTVAQEVEREGGYLAVIGKQGPAFMWDNRVASVKEGRDELLQPHKDYLFASDTLTMPPELAADIHMPPPSTTGVLDSERDGFFTRLLTERAMLAAKNASAAGRPSLLVLWQHNPDLTQHIAGLGTLPAIEALSTCDLNLAKIRAAIVTSNISDRTDLIVVSDHGFATIRFTVNVNAMLAEAGLKKSETSTDVVVARNGGSDLVYLSRDAFPTAMARRTELQKIADFAEAQEWCGPIFSKPPTLAEAEDRDKPYLGSIDGTFSMAAAGIMNASRAPDLVISFREISDEDNENVTGPGAPAFAFGGKGQRSVPNRSKVLVHPVKGLVYADAKSFTTGMGMHGAAGEREIHNFCAAFGPDFRRQFVDRYPSANTDIAPTITHLLGLLPNLGAGGLYPSGRVLSEALSGERASIGAPHAIAESTSLELQGVQVRSTLRFTRLGDRDYLDDSVVERNPLGSSP